MSYTFTNTTTFTVTHAKQLASKVATDLKRMQRFYDYPSDSYIELFEEELVELLKAGHLEKVTYGFQRDNNWIEPTLIYTAKDLGSLIGTDDDPGKIKPGANVYGASFSSYLEFAASWWAITEAERNQISSRITLQRESRNNYGISGYLSIDKTYSSGGKSLERSIVKSF